MTLAGIYAAQGYYNKALKIYRDILQKEPENVEVQGMVDKLQTLLDSSEKERGEAFDSEDLTVSIERIDEESPPEPRTDDEEPAPETAEPVDADVSEERGFILVDKPGGAPAESDRREEEKPVTEEKEPGAKRAEPKKRSKEKAKEEETEPGDVENFQSWLRKLKGD
jgi:hypothetical protein